MKVDFIRHAAGITAVVTGIDDESAKALALEERGDNGLSVIVLADDVEWELAD